MKKIILNIIKTVAAIVLTIACGIFFGILLISADICEHKELTDYDEDTDTYEIAMDIVDTLTA